MIRDGSNGSLNGGGSSGMLRQLVFQPLSQLLTLLMMYWLLPLYGLFQFQLIGKPKYFPIISNNVVILFLIDSYTKCELYASKVSEYTMLLRKSFKGQDL